VILIPGHRGGDHWEEELRWLDLVLASGGDPDAERRSTDYREATMATAVARQKDSALILSSWGWAPFIPLIGGSGEADRGSS
jgi:hypothetical protein